MLKQVLCSEDWYSKWEYVKHILLFWIIMLRLDIRFVPIPRPDGMHYYGIYIFELFGVCFLLRLLQCYFRGNLEKRYVVMLRWLIVFILYYVGLFCVRIMTGNNYADSLMLFRNLFWICVCVVYFLQRGTWAKGLYSFYIGMVALQGFELFFYMMDGYWRNIFGLPSVLISLSPFMIPAGWMVVDAYRFNSYSKFSVLIGSFFSVAIILLSGARIGYMTLLLSLASGLTIVAFKMRNKRPYKAFARYIAIILIMCCLVFVADMGGTRDSAVRAAGGMYSPFVDLLQKEDMEAIMGRLDIAYVEYVQKWRENHSEKRRRGVLDQNPIGISDTYRVLAMRMAVNKLSGDWLFHLQGDTLLHIPTGNTVSVSGAHNAVLDYCMAFGVCGTAIIFSMWFYWLSQFWKIRHIIDLEEWWAVMLILFGLLLNGMFQAMFNNFSSLLMPSLLLAVIALKKHQMDID